MMSPNSCPIDGYGDETDAHGHYVGSQPLRAPEPTPADKTILQQFGVGVSNVPPSASMTEDEQKQYLAGIQLPPIENEWENLLTESERDALRKANDMLGDETNTIDLGDFCCYQVPVLMGTIRRLARNNVALRNALATIAETVATAADHE